MLIFTLIETLKLTGQIIFYFIFFTGSTHTNICVETVIYLSLLIKVLWKLYNFLYILENLP
jgi:hypothetical protein